MGGEVVIGRICGKHGILLIADELRTRDPEGDRDEWSRVLLNPLRMSVTSMEYCRLQLK